jgi:hypothetical protein
MFYKVSNGGTLDIQEKTFSMVLNGYDTDKSYSVDLSNYASKIKDDGSNLRAAIKSLGSQSTSSTGMTMGVTFKSLVYNPNSHIATVTYHNTISATTLNATGVIFIIN